MCPAAAPPLSRPGAVGHPGPIRRGARIAAAAIAVWTGAAFGSGEQAAAASDVGGSVALTSDYVYHGLSHTCGAPALQADLQIGTSGGEGPSELYAGAWGSAGLGSGYCHRSREVDLYAGVRLAPSATQSLTLSYIHYAFPGGNYLYEPVEGRRFDYDELDGTWAFEDRLFFTFAWTPNAIEYRRFAIRRDRGAPSFGAELHQPVGLGFTFSAGVGYDQMSDPSGAGYAFWNAGFEHRVGPVQVDLSYYRTAPRAERLFGPQVAGGRVAASAIWRF